MHRGSARGDKNHRSIVERLKEVISAITECFGAEEIILFGSFARGESSLESSMDMLVVARTDVPFVERIVRVLECVPEGEPPVDVLVYTPEEISKKLEESESFVMSAMHEGVLIWSKREKVDLETQLQQGKSQSEFKGLLREVE